MCDPATLGLAIVNDQSCFLKYQSLKSCKWGLGSLGKGDKSSYS